MIFRYLGLILIMAVLTVPRMPAAETQGRYVELSTARLWIIDSGGAGKAVIRLHPRTGNADFWQGNIPALADAGYRAIAIDYPGWGRSVPRDPADPEPVAVTVAALLDELGLETVHVIGTAMGGYVALDFAAGYPDRTRTLVIAASGLGLEGDPEYDLFRERAEIPGMSEQASVYREVSPNYRAINPAGVERWLEIYANGQQQGSVRAPLLSPNTPAKLASIRAPTLFIAGGIDLVTPSGAMRLYSRHMTVPYTFKVIAEAGHVLAWEQPGVFNRLVIDFLGGN